MVASKMSSTKLTRAINVITTDIQTDTQTHRPTDQQNKNSKKKKKKDTTVVTERESD